MCGTKKMWYFMANVRSWKKDNK